MVRLVMIIDVDSIVYYFITVNFNLHNMFINTWLIVRTHRTQEYKLYLCLEIWHRMRQEKRKEKREVSGLINLEIYYNKTTIKTKT